MKTKVMIALLAAALCAPAFILAQSAPNQNNDQQAQQHEQQEQNQAAQVNMMGGSTQPEHHMIGTVAEGGKRFVSDNTSYLVANPHLLQKYDNQTVSVIFQFDASSNKLHIMKVSPSQ